MKALTRLEYHLEAIISEVNSGRDVQRLCKSIVVEKENSEGGFERIFFDKDSIKKKHSRGGVTCENAGSESGPKPMLPSSPPPQRLRSRSKFRKRRKKSIRHRGRGRFMKRGRGRKTRGRFQRRVVNPGRKAPPKPSRPPPPPSEVPKEEVDDEATKSEPKIEEKKPEPTPEHPSKPARPPPREIKEQKEGQEKKEVKVESMESEQASKPPPTRPSRPPNKRPTSLKIENEKKISEQLKDVKSPAKRPSRRPVSMRVGSVNTVVVIPGRRLLRKPKTGMRIDTETGINQVIEIKKPPTPPDPPRPPSPKAEVEGEEAKANESEKSQSLDQPETETTNKVEEEKVTQQPEEKKDEPPSTTQPPTKPTAPKATPTEASTTPSPKVVQQQQQPRKIRLPPRKKGLPLPKPKKALGPLPALPPSRKKRKKKDQDVKKRILSLFTFLAVLINEKRRKKGDGGEVESSKEKDTFKEPVFTKEEFDEKVPDITQTIEFSKFLNEKFGNNSKVMKLIKCCDQFYVIYLLSKLMKIVQSIPVIVFPLPSPQPASTQQPNQPPQNQTKPKDRLFFKDCRGKWKIFIKLHQNPDRFSLTHRRIEQMMMMHQRKNYKLFQFEWEVEICFDSLEFNCIDAVSARIVPYSTGGDNEEEKDKEEEKKKVEKSLVDWKCCDENPIVLKMVDKRLYENILSEVFRNSERKGLWDKHLKRMELYRKRISFIQSELDFDSSPEEKLLELCVKYEGDLHLMLKELYKPVIIEEYKNKLIQLENMKKEAMDQIRTKEEERKLKKEEKSKLREEKRIQREEKKKLKLQRKEEERKRKEEEKLRRIKAKIRRKMLIEKAKKAGRKDFRNSKGTLISINVSSESEEETEESSEEESSSEEEEEEEEEGEWTTASSSSEYETDSEEEEEEEGEWEWEEEGEEEKKGQVQEKTGVENNNNNNVGGNE